MADFERPDQVSVVIRPSGGDDNSLSASDFVKQVDALRQLLSLSAKAGCDARIVKMHMNSPATVVMETIAPDSSAVNLTSYLEGIEAIALTGAAPRDFSRPVFEALKDFAAVVGRGVRSATIEGAGKTILIDVAARKRIESAFGEDTSSEGSVDGMLEAVNVHGKSNVFALYPVIGAARVNCKFADGLLASVRPALGKYVIIRGELKYRWREKHPHEALAHAIEVQEDWDNQPSFIDLLGMAPHATGGIPAEDFVRNLRNGWQ